LQRFLRRWGIHAAHAGQRRRSKRIQKWDRGPHARGIYPVTSLRLARVFGEALYDGLDARSQTLGSLIPDTLDRVLAEQALDRTAIFSRSFGSMAEIAVMLQQ
jgi:hypothetical protein